MRVAEERAYVIYRASGRGGRPVEVHLVATPAAATVADAWARLTRLDPSVDPRSLEIETRLLPRQCGGANVGRYVPRRSPSAEGARRLAGGAAMAHDAGP